MTQYPYIIFEEAFEITIKEWERMACVLADMKVDRWFFSELAFIPSKKGAKITPMQPQCMFAKENITHGKS